MQLRRGLYAHLEWREWRIGKKVRHARSFAIGPYKMTMWSFGPLKITRYQSGASYAE